MRVCVFVLYVRVFQPESLEARCISGTGMTGSGEGRREEAKRSDVAQIENTCKVGRCCGGFYMTSLTALEEQTDRPADAVF